MLNDGCEPSTLFWLRSALTDFNAALSPLIQEMTSKNNTHLQAVMDWVEMEQIRQTNNTPDATKPAQDNAQKIKEQTLETVDMEQIRQTNNDTNATEPAQDNAQKVTEQMLETEPKEKLMYPWLAAYGIDDIMDLSGSIAVS